MPTLSVVRGSTYAETMSWGTDPMLSSAITAITKGYPVRLTSASHGLKNGWPVTITSALGMTEINDANFPPKKDSDWHEVTVIDANTISLDINSSAYGTYTSAGLIVYPTPVDMTGYTFRMAFKDKVGGKVLVCSTTGNTWTASTAYRLGQIIAPHGSMVSGSGKMLQCTTAGTSGSVNSLTVPALGATLTDGTVVWTAVALGVVLTADNVAKTIVRSISAAFTATVFPKSTGVYDIESVSSSGVVEKLDSGDFEVGVEVTT